MTTLAEQANYIADLWKWFEECPLEDVNPILQAVEVEADHRAEVACELARGTPMFDTILRYADGHKPNEDWSDEQFWRWVADPSNKA